MKTALTTILFIMLLFCNFAGGFESDAETVELNKNLQNMKMEQQQEEMEVSHMLG